MKYIDAEKLRAEIKALKERYGSYVAKNEVEACYKGGRLIGYKDALDKINKLQQEQPEVDLEKEIDEYFAGWSTDSEYGGAVKPDYYGCALYDCKDIARHFYELARQKYEK